MSTTDSDEVNYEAQYDQIEDAAKDQLILLHEDLEHLLSGESIYDTRKEFAGEQLGIDADTLALGAENVALEKDKAFASRETELRETRLTAATKTDDINEDVVKAGFMSGPGGDRARKMLTDSLQVKSEAGDLTYLDTLASADIDFKSDIADFGAADMSYREDVAESDNDLYEALRGLYTEIETVKGEARGSTGREINDFAEFSWGSYEGLGGWDDVWDTYG